MLDYKSIVAQDFIKGEGIEIGALHSPFPVQPGTKVRYVDRLSVEDLRKQYTELDKYILVNVDIVDDGELLDTIPDSSQDFVIESHFLEHARNPINAIRNGLRVLKEDGYFVLVIPDKNYNIELLRTVTKFDHLLDDENVPSATRDFSHYKDFALYFCNIFNAEARERLAMELEEKKYSVHFHSWTQFEMLEMFSKLRTDLKFPFELELFARNVGAVFDGAEIVVVLRKTTLLDQVEKLKEFSEKVGTLSAPVNEITALRTTLANAFFSSTKLSAAKQQILMAMENDPENSGLYIEICKIFINSYSFEAAEEWIKKAKAKFPALNEFEKLEAELKRKLC